MNRPLLAVAALGLLLASCATSAQRDLNKHWSDRSISPRIARFFLGYDAEKEEGTYRDFAWRRKQDINLTLRRHFLNHNPDNPNHDPVPSRFEPRPVNSPLPNPFNYFHLEALFLGGVPLDSLIGTMEPGGWDEFFDGFSYLAKEEGSAKPKVMTASYAHPISGDAPRAVTTVTRVDR